MNEILIGTAVGFLLAIVYIILVDVWEERKKIQRYLEDQQRKERLAKEYPDDPR